MTLAIITLAIITLPDDQVHPSNAYAASNAFYQPATFAAPNYGASPLAYAAAPLAYSASPLAHREGLLTTVKLNPSHALSYRVD